MLGGAQRDIASDSRGCYRHACHVCSILVVLVFTEHTEAVMYLLVVVVVRWSSLLIV